MASLYESLDSLPYIDQDISQADRDNANKLMRRELPPRYQENEHASLQALPEVKFSSLIQTELERCANGTPFTKAIDLSRYEAPDEPEPNSDIETYRGALRNAYTSSTYLAGRRTNLQLLDEFGKNSWLIGNFELEGLLKTFETELADIKLETEQVNKARKAAQEGSRGEIVALEESWRKGIGKIIEVQLVTDQLRSELSERRRNAAN